MPVRATHLLVVRHVSSGIAAGIAAGAVWSALLERGAHATPWQSAALGAVMGAGWGALAGPLTAWLHARRGDDLRAWTLAHGRGVAAAAFLAPVCLVATWFTVSLALGALLARVQVAQVEVLVALVGALAPALVLGSASVAAGRALRPRLAPPRDLRAAVLLPVAAGLATACGLVWLADSALDLRFGAEGWISPFAALLIAAQVTDLVGALVLFTSPVLALLLSGLTARRGGVIAALALSATLLVALSRARDTSEVARLPGPRRAVLVALQRLSDGDGDGYARRFGGGDCDDSNPAVNPGQREVPGNGADDNCAEGDLSRAYLDALATTDPMTPEVRAAMEAVVPRGMDVVLLTVDALRADLHFAGNPREVSPNLDRLAARSVVFTHAYATSTATLQSLPALMTGRYTSELERSDEHNMRSGRSNVFLAERLIAGGWSTGAVVSSTIFGDAWGLLQGIDQVDRRPVPPRAWQGVVVDDVVASRMERFIDAPPSHRDRHMLWAHFYDPHDGYVEHVGVGDFGPPPAGLYWQEVAWTDRQIGRVLDALDALPEPRRGHTALVVTADHGEALGEHGTLYHGNGLWEVQLRVPLIVCVPGLAPRRVDVPRSLIDLAPTLLDLLRIPPPAANAGDAFAGRSLVPDLLGLAPASRPIFASLRGEDWNGVAMEALIVDGRKIIRRGGAPAQLFDLAADPSEDRDLAAARPAELARMRGLLAGFRARMREVPSRAHPPLGF